MLPLRIGFNKNDIIPAYEQSSPLALDLVKLAGVPYNFLGYDEILAANNLSEVKSNRYDTCVGLLARGLLDLCPLYLSITEERLEVGDFPRRICLDMFRAGLF